MSAWDKRGFSRKQHGFFRPMVAAAWEAHCKRNALPSAQLQLLEPDEVKSAVAERIEKSRLSETQRAWYEDNLEAACGKNKRSTTICDPKRDFEHAMAHFEAIARNGIYWNMRVHGGDARRIAWNIGELCRKHDVEEDYMRGCLRNALQLFPNDPLPRLEDVPYEVLIIIMGELKRWIRRDPGTRRRGRPRTVRVAHGDSLIEYEAEGAPF